MPPNRWRPQNVEWHAAVVFVEIENQMFQRGIARPEDRQTRRETSDRASSRGSRDVA